MIVIRLITIIITLTVLSKTYMDYKKGRETLSMFLFWIITWSIVVALALWPSVYFNLQNYFQGFGVGVVTFIGLLFIFLFFVTYRVYVKAQRLERQLKDLVVKLGIKDIEK